MLLEEIDCSFIYGYLYPLNNKFRVIRRRNMETLSEGREIASNMERCIRDCLSCFENCTRTISYCVSQGGKHVEADHLKIMMECIDMSRMSATLMMSNAPFSHEHCQLCAKVCDSCALSCSKMENDKTMQECADICRKCADSCRSMAH